MIFDTSGYFCYSTPNPFSAKRQKETKKTSEQTLFVILIQNT